MDEGELIDLLKQLLKLSKECEWVEFKENFHSFEEIGERISALSNGACLFNQQNGYLVFGVRDNIYIKNLQKNIPHVFGQYMTTERTENTQTYSGKGIIKVWSTRYSPPIVLKVCKVHKVYG